jgi:PAS domain S-box-containing protein
VSTPLRVLFVEDSRADVELMLHELRRGGFDPTFEVVDTSETLNAALVSKTWDVVIADHGMPRFSAPDALSVVKRSGHDIPFIVVSGSIGEELAVACMKAGAHDYLIKNNLKRLTPVVQREVREAAVRVGRREAEAAFLLSEERYRLLVENAADIITVVDVQGRITFESPSVTHVLGYTPEEMIGTPVLDFVHPDDVALVKNVMAQALGTGNPVTVTELRVRHKDGSWRIVEGSGTRFFDHNGTPYLLGGLRDITDRVQLREQLHQAQKMEAVGRLAGGVAHDFNNLLTVILGYSNLLLDQLAGRELLHQEVEEVKRAATRAATLTQQLLAFSRKQVLSLKVLNLNDVIEGMRALMKRLIGENVQIEFHLDPVLGSVRVDPGQMEQVIMNLLINSKDAMPDGGRITIQTANVDLDDLHSRHVSAAPPGPYIMLSVCDTGIGMDAETRARLFEPFFTTKEPGKGTGLGLSTVYGIVNQTGGSITVASEPGHGSVFRIYLPRVRERADRPEPSRSPDTPVGGTETVMLVEDEDLVRGLVRDILARQGYIVLDAADGQSALETARRHRGPIQLLVTDVVMPGMSGLELADSLTHERPDTRVIYISGYTDERVMRRGTPQPGTAFLQKPFTPEALLRVTREVLDARVDAHDVSMSGRPQRPL